MTGEPAEPYREFISQMILRLEHAGRAVNRELAGVRVEVAGLKAGQDQMRGEVRELREDSRAQTRALLRVLDRLEGGGGATT